MTTATDRARNLLKALPVPLCDCCHISCRLCQKVADITRLGFTPATLAVAITAVEALKALDGLWINHDREVHADNPEERPLGCPTCKALAEWGRLFP